MKNFVVMFIFILILVFVQFFPIIQSVKNCTLIIIIVPLIFTWIKEIHIQNRQSKINLALTSTISVKIFEKQVEFSECYFKIIDSLFSKYIEKGPTEDFISMSWELEKKRKEFYLWLDKSQHKKLLDFEFKVRNAGASEMLARHTNNSDERLQAIKETFDLTGELFGIKKEPLINEIKEQIKNDLKIGQVWELRQKTFNEVL